MLQDWAGLQHTMRAYNKYVSCVLGLARSSLCGYLKHVIDVRHCFVLVSHNVGDHRQLDRDYVGVAVAVGQTNLFLFCLLS